MQPCCPSSRLLLGNGALQRRAAIVVQRLKATPEHQSQQANARAASRCLPGVRQLTHTSLSQTSGRMGRSLTDRTLIHSLATSETLEPQGPSLTRASHSSVHRAAEASPIAFSTSTEAAAFNIFPHISQRRRNNCVRMPSRNKGGMPVAFRPSMTRPMSADATLADYQSSRTIGGRMSMALGWLDRSTDATIFDFLDTAPKSRPAYQFVTGASAMPKVASSKVTVQSSDHLSVQVGEDAYFLRHDAMGVADGVGGWVNSDDKAKANPALYSRKIMHYASQYLERFDDAAGDYTLEDYYGVDPRGVLQYAYDLTQRDSDSQGVVGSTTAMIAILRDDELRVANLGDCGLFVIRGSEAIFRSEEQQHFFNFPFQIGTNCRDTPLAAQLYKLKIHEGDIVVMGSDGIFDNVFDEDVMEVVSSVVAGGNPAYADPQRITEALLKKARSVAEDDRCLASPFQNRAVQEGLYYQGGKLDDCTVLVGVVRLFEDSPDRR